MAQEKYFLNDFQKEHYERCLKENARVKSMHFSHEYAKAQSERMKDLLRQEEEKSKS